MATYEIYSPPRTGGKGAERICKTGFSRAAFVFAPFWLAWHRIWIALVFYLVLAIVVIAAAASGFLAIGGAVALLIVVHALVALEGPERRGAAWVRRGFALTDIVEAPRADDAAFLFFARLPAPATPPVVREGVRAAVPTYGEPQVLGLFPTPERRK